MIWAASRFFLRVSRRKKKLYDGYGYTYHATRKEAVAALIAREEEAIRKLEKQVAQGKRKLAAFRKKHARTRGGGE